MVRQLSGSLRWRSSCGSSLPPCAFLLHTKAITYRAHGTHAEKRTPTAAHLSEGFLQHAGAGVFYGNDNSLTAAASNEEVDERSRCLRPNKQPGGSERAAAASCPRHAGPHLLPLRQSRHPDGHGAGQRLCYCQASCPAALPCLCGTPARGTKGHRISSCLTCHPLPRLPHPAGWAAPPATSGRPPPFYA